MKAGDKVIGDEVHHQDSVELPEDSKCSGKVNDNSKALAFVVADKEAVSTYGTENSS